MKRSSTNRKLWQHLIALLCMGVISVLPGCDSKAPESALDIDAGLTAEPATAQFKALDADQASTLRQILRRYLEQADDNFDRVADSLSRLQYAVSEFLGTPAPDTLAAARSAWLDAHSAYEYTGLHLYLADLLIEDSNRLRWLEQQYRINHWPILPGFIDYVSNYPGSGIIYDTGVELNPNTLRQQHGAFAIDEVTTGFHVLEFLLWGEYADGVASRPVTDFEQQSVLSAEQLADGYAIDQVPPNRRRELLQLVSNALQEDFEVLHTMWNNISENTRAELSDLKGSEILWLLLQSNISMLTEEMLVRSLYPLLNREYQDSFQSPYSRTTATTVSVQLNSVEELLLHNPDAGGLTLDRVLADLSADFEVFFYQGFDAIKGCMAMLYSGFTPPESEQDTLQLEFQIVECINPVTNLIDHLQRISLTLLDANETNPVESQQ